MPHAVLTQTRLSPAIINLKKFSVIDRDGAGLKWNGRGNRPVHRPVSVAILFDQFPLDFGAKERIDVDIARLARRVAQMQFFPVVNTLHEAAADSADDRATELWAQLKPEGRELPCGVESKVEQHFLERFGHRIGTRFQPMEGMEVVLSGLAVNALG